MWLFNTLRHNKFCHLMCMYVLPLCVFCLIIDILSVAIIRKLIHYKQTMLIIKIFTYGNFEGNLWFLFFIFFFLHIVIHGMKYRVWQRLLFHIFHSKWLLSNAKWAIFQLYHDRTSYFWWDNNDVRFVLDQHY